MKHLLYAKRSKGHATRTFTNDAQNVGKRNHSKKKLFAFEKKVILEA